METLFDLGVENKLCSKCGEWKPLSEYYFKRKEKNQGFSWCVACHAIIIAENNRKNPEKAHARVIAWQKANPEKVRESRFKSRAKHAIRLREKARSQYAEKRREKKRLYRQSNAEKIKARNAKYRAEHKAEINAYGHKYYAENADACNARIKEWGKRNPQKKHDSAVASWHRRKVRKVNNGPVERFSSREIYERDNWICHLCRNSVDKNLKFPDPFSVSLDHIQPIARGGGHTRANVACSHLRCNLKKNAYVDRFT